MKKQVYKRKNSYFNWISYCGTLIVLGFLGALPAVIFGGTEFLKLSETKRFLIWYILYWIGVTAVVSLLTAWQKYVSFERPMRELSAATEQVAKGDFSVCLKPVRRFNKKDYVDHMFEDFNRMVEDLASIETMKNDFISNVSHEIKTPLAVIQNYITALQEDGLSDDKKRAYMETLFASTQRLTELVSNILKLSKLENQVIEVNVKPYNLSRQLSECILQYEVLLDKKQIEVEADIEEGVILEGDESIAELIWNNLLSNALKFTHAGGTIRIRQKTDDNGIYVEIQDTGCGMDEKTQKHLFDKFYQGDTSHATEGNGLGMALVKRSVEMLHGNIRIESQLGKGSSFQVEFPKKKVL